MYVAQNRKHNALGQSYKTTLVYAKTHLIAEMGSNCQKIYPLFCGVLLSQAAEDISLPRWWLTL
jgi:hypothetical protein